MYQEEDTDLKDFFRETVAGNSDFVKNKLETAKDVPWTTTVDPKGNLALHFVASSGTTELVDCLVQAGSPVDRFNNIGRTPFLEALSAQHSEVCKSLLAQGAKANYRFPDGTSPLHFAISNSLTEVVHELLKRGVDTNCRDLEGRTPLHAAVEQDDRALLEALLSAPATDPNRRDASGRSALHAAFDKSNFTLVEVLMSHEGVDANQRDRSGDTVLHKAVALGNCWLLEMLLSKDKVDPNAKDDKGDTPLHRAISKGNLLAAQVLLSSERVDPNAWNNEGDGALLQAINEKAPHTIVELFFSHPGIDVDGVGSNGWTPLCLAAHQGSSFQIVDLLLSQRGIKGTSLNRALYRSIVGGHREVSRLLVERGADPCEAFKSREKPQNDSLLKEMQALHRILHP